MKAFIYTSENVILGPLASDTTANFNFAPIFDLSNLLLEGIGNSYLF